MSYEINQIPDSMKNTINKRLSGKPSIHDTACVINSTIGSWTEIGSRSVIIETTIGDYSYDAGDVSIIYATIGKFCSIASHVRINPGNHPMERVTQHHCTYRRVQYGFGAMDDLSFFNRRRSRRCIIGHDVWIGHGAVIMPGVHVATGAVVGAGAVVTRNVGPYEIAVGVPARVIKKRFDGQIIKRLLSSEWWEWERRMLEERFADFLSPDIFLDKYCNRERLRVKHGAAHD
ncbi:MAG: hypothetical protein JW881_05730 [Spirochaetales bacterium]|nr:hypothetical protein [Spirochaetales bacterium]